MLDNINVEADLINNEYSYESLISAIESSQGMLVLLIASCEPGDFQNRLIDRYETELAPKIPSYRINLDRSEPSLRAVLEQLINDRSEFKQPQASGVITVTGAADLSSIKLKETETNSALDRFFGYLQWTREGLREFRYPIVLWVTPKILHQLSSKAPDFWSWRGGVFRFMAPVVIPTNLNSDRHDISSLENLQQTTDLPLDELLEQIVEIEKQNLTSPALATLFDRVGQVYGNRIGGDYSDNWHTATEYFNRAISIQTKLDLKADLANTLRRLGNVYQNQGKWDAAIACYEQSLETFRQLGDTHGVARNLNNLGIVYGKQGKWDEAIACYEQSLETFRQLGDTHGVAQSLMGLGNVYNKQGKLDQAIACYEKSLETFRQLGDTHGVAQSLMGLGIVYGNQCKWDQEIACYEQSLETKHQLGDTHGVAKTLGNLGNVYLNQGKWDEAIACYEESLKISRQLGDTHGVGQTLTNLGLVHDQRNQIEQAKSLWREALTYLHPSSPEFQTVQQWLAIPSPPR